MEYIKLNSEEQAFAEKNLLYSQMEILNIMKSYRRYKKLKAEEHTYKLVFKRKAKEIREQIDDFYKLLPALPKQHKEQIKIVQEVKIQAPPQQKQKNRDALEIEIDDIKRKIAMLSES